MNRHTNDKQLLRKTVKGVMTNSYIGKRVLKLNYRAIVSW